MIVIFNKLVLIQLFGLNFMNIENTLHTDM